MTLTLANYTAITGLGFDGEVAPLDSRYQTAALGAELVRTLLGFPTRPRYTAQGYVSYKVVYKFWAERIRTRLAAWRELPADARPAAPAYMREERDQAARSFIFYIIFSQLLCTWREPLPGWPACGIWAVLALMTGLLSPWLIFTMVWAYEYRIYPGGPRSDSPTNARRIPRYLAHRHHTFSSSEDPHYWRCYLDYRALADLLLTPWEGDAWAAYPSRAMAEAFTRSRRRVPAAPPRHMCILEGMAPEDQLLEYDGSSADVFLIPGDYASYFTTRLQARLPKVREYSQDRRRQLTPTYYRAQAEAEVPAGPAGAVLGDVPFPPGMEVALDPTLGLGPAIIIPTDLRQAPPPLQLDPEHATHVPAQRYQELYQRFGFARSYIARLYPELHERRHQSHQSDAIARLQMEVDRLRTRLEVEGIPLDFSEEEDDDDDGSSSDYAPTPSPSSVGQAAAGPSRRRC
ncbi:hypothetical protein JCGZ_15407 [Jatropha curcas]|uniref:Aminotransferase-like plant mobile domain-containing protein n=1 Tax=Jatropha curcas TaxID=180498 RepID=A0A067K5L4_JATCU|nr:hypothetical protein JCGZ_15407 [Jatropha curcas]